MKKTSLLALILAATTTLTLLTGCTKSNPETTSDSTDAGAQTTATSPKTTTESPQTTTEPPQTTDAPTVPATEIPEPIPMKLARSVQGVYTLRIPEDWEILTADPLVRMPYGAGTASLTVSDNSGRNAYSTPFAYAEASKARMIESYGDDLAGDVLITPATLGGKPAVCIDALAKLDIDYYKIVTVAAIENDYLYTLGMTVQINASERIDSDFAAILDAFQFTADATALGIEAPTKVAASVEGSHTMRIPESWVVISTDPLVVRQGDYYFRTTLNILDNSGKDAYSDPFDFAEDAKLPIANKLGDRLKGEIATSSATFGGKPAARLDLSVVDEDEMHYRWIVVVTIENGKAYAMTMETGDIDYDFADAYLVSFLDAFTFA